MGNLFGGPPKATTSTPTAAQLAAQAAAANASPPNLSSPSVAGPSQSYTDALAAAAGRGSTVLTGGQGDTSIPNIQRKVLLGG